MRTPNQYAIRTLDLLDEQRGGEEKETVDALAGLFAIAMTEARNQGVEAGRATIDRLQRELAEARAYISTIIDAPKDYPAEGSA